MFTRCPNCRCQQRLTVEQLRVSRAIVSCRRCALKFDALELLSDTATVDTGFPHDTEVLPWELPRRSPYWRPALLVGIVALLMQVVYFEGRDLSQHDRLRPGLEQLCRHLGCQLPAYKNLDGWLLQGALTPSPNRSYLVTAAISNHATFAQPYPNIKLTLLNYSGSPFAHRIFYPHEYAVGTVAASPLIEAGATVTIQLNIAATKNHIGGYTFDILN
ncbi:MAG: zinc-ribbon and DUF3426 domain-containing protein [Methylovulum sp.]|nr:zinc-ribbon and DUF3426 domain-containing protein [Methylovulum sp.]